MSASPLLRVGDVDVYRAGGADDALVWCAGLSVDADGAPTAYSPAGSGLRGLDDLANAGRPGHWYGVATHTGRPDGEPVVQGAGDPAPGWYVSTTALVDPARAPGDPRRYVDASTVPYLSVPPELETRGVRRGDVALVLRLATGTSQAAIVADVGPRRRLGEGSIALAEALGLPSSPRTGGTARGIAVAVWPGSSLGWPRLLGDIARQVDELFAALGGAPRLRDLLGIGAA